jgi:N-succinyldiaminopimelate aminotransferase
LRAPDFALDVDELRAAVTPATRVILLNSPHNPTGSVLSPAELTAIAAVAVEHDLVVISDEVYEHLTFDGLAHLPISTLPGMADRTVTIGSAGKTFSFTGWKVGWVTGSAELVATVRTTKQFLTFVSAGPFQYAVAEALALPESTYAELRDRLQFQRDLLCDGLAGLGFEVYRPQGTYFASTDVRPLGWEDGLDFCRELPGRCGVVAIPHQVFYDNVEVGRPLVRWAFCKQPAVLTEAVDRLAAGRLAR